MKFLIYVLLVAFSISYSSILLAQNNIEPDKRLNSKYSQEYLTNLIHNNPETLEYLNFCLDHSYYIITDDNHKLGDCQPLVPIDNSTKQIADNYLVSGDITKFNYLDYKFEISYNERSFYRIGNTDNIVVFYSSKEMAEKFNNYKKSVK